MCPDPKLKGKIVIIYDFCHKVIVTISVLYCIYLLSFNKSFSLSHPLTLPLCFADGSTPTSTGSRPRRCSRSAATRAASWRGPPRATRGTSPSPCAARTEASRTSRYRDGAPRVVRQDLTPEILYCANKYGLKFV